MAGSQASTPAPRRLRVLLSAYACEPGVGSEGGIGWNWTREVARRNDCVLVTRKNNVEAIRAAAQREDLERLEVVGHDLPMWMRFWKRGGRGAMAYFYLWQLSLARVARRLDRERDFDLVQHVTFASSWIPSGLAFVNKPFVWGPVGQHPRIPKPFLVDAPLAARLAESAKAAVKRLCLTVDPFLRHTMRRARRVLSLGSEFEDSSTLPKSARVERLHACGVDALAPGVKSGGHVLFSGRLVRLKGPELALEAFATAHAKHTGARLTFLGEGPLETQLRQRAEALGITGAVTFAGKLPLHDALAQMGAADIFLFPSFEGAGMVVPEAMATGAVVLCLDFGGPGDMVAEGRGLAVPVGATKAQACANLAAGLDELLGDPMRCAQLRSGAEDWIRSDMLWSQKGARLQGIYEAVMAETCGEAA